MSVVNLTGKAMSLTWKGAGVDLTKVTPRATRDMKDNTSTKNYDNTGDIVWKSQLPATASLNFDIEGNLDIGASPSSTAFLAELLSGNAPVAAVFNLNATTVFGHGSFDINSFEVTAQVDDVIKFRASAMSNDKFTYGS